MVLPGIVSFTIYQGCAWVESIDWENPDGSATDATGYLFRLTGKSPGGFFFAGSTGVSLPSDIPNGCPTGSINIGDSTGVISINMTSSVTPLLALEVYQINISYLAPSQDWLPLLIGAATIVGGP